MAPAVAVEDRLNVGVHNLQAHLTRDSADGIVSTDELARKLMTLAGQIAVAEAQWLVWLGEWCVRQGWERWGCNSPVQWLSWRCGMSPSTAREKVRVACAMRELPAVTNRFLQGRLSYSKVRAITRIAEPHNEHELANLGVAATGAQLDRIVRARASATSDSSQASAWEQRNLQVRRTDHDGQDVIACVSVTLADHDADRLLARVNAEVDAMIDDALDGNANEMTRSEYMASRGGRGAMRADAILALVLGTERSQPPAPAPVEVVINADDHAHHVECTCSCATEQPVPERRNGAPAEALAAPDASVEFSIGGRQLPGSVGARLCCDPRVSALVENSNADVLSLGRSQRFVTRKLRRALNRRDNHQCTFPACDARQRLHAHHIIHWTNGGPTELDNLTLVCDFHHHLVHEGGWNISRVTRRFHMPNGTEVPPACGERSRGSARVVLNAPVSSAQAPLGEATADSFDLGLTLEALAQLDPDRPISPALDWTPTYEYGPAIPASVRFERVVRAHQERFGDHWSRWN